MKRKLFLIFHGRFPSEKAAAFFAAESASAFGGQGYEVTLLVPRRLGRSKESCQRYYGVESNFRLAFLPVIDLFKIPFFKSFAFYLSFISFSFAAFFYLICCAERSDIIYSNESLPLLLASFVFPRTAYEIHDFPTDNFYYRAVMRRIKLFVSTNLWKKEKIKQIFNVPDKKIIAEPNAVSIEHFSKLPSKLEARKMFRLPSDSRLLCYVGMLRTMGMEKGIDILLKALKFIADCQLLVVGGSDEDVAFYKKVAGSYGVSDKVIFTGFVSHRKVPLYLSAADILVAPFPKSDHYEFYMSPMKIFEYMASSRPIVTTDLESIREILPSDAVVMVPPDNPRALADAVRKVFDNKTFGEKLAVKAREVVLTHTWEKRAERILKFVDA